MKNKCLGVFLAFLFVPIFLLTFVLYNFKNTFLNVDFYKSEFRKADFYTHTAEFMPKFVQGFAKDEQTVNLVRAMQEAIKADWLKNETEKNLDNAFNWYYGKTDNFVIEVQLTSLKGDFEKIFFKEMEKNYNALPECNKSKSEALINCRIPGKSFEQIQQEFLAQGTQEGSKENKSLINEFPDVYRFEKTPQDFTSSKIKFLSSSPGRIFNLTFYILLGLSVFLFTVIGLMAKESLRSLFRWFGVILIIPGSLLLIFSILMRIGVNVMPSVTSFVSLDSAVDYSPLAEIFNPLIKTMSFDIVNKKLLESGIIFGLALILIIISFFFKNNQASPKTSEVASSNALENK